jgi:hypothetical protein
MAPRHDSEHSSAFREEALLLRAFAACSETLIAAGQALSHPTRSMLLLEFKERKIELEVARAECEKARTALREDRERRRAQVRG